MLTITNEDCQERSHKSNLTNSTLCAVPRKANSGSGSCDSGGPLFINRTIVGVVSWGASDIVDAFARVSEFATWINQSMKKE